MNSVLLWIGGLLIAALALLFAVPAVIDWNSYRGVFEEEASRLLGRDVRVGGKVALRLLPTPYVRFEKVRISDADASLGEPFFRTESFTLWLSAVPLLRGAIEANEIEFDRPVLRLAVAADGTGNWQSLRRTSGALPFVPSDVVLQQIKIRHGTVSLRTPDQPTPAELTGIEGELAAGALAGPYRFRGSVDWGGVPREIRMAASPPEDDGHLRFKINMRVPETGSTYAFDGSLSELTTRARLEGSLTGRLPIAVARSGARPEPARPAKTELGGTTEGDKSAAGKVTGEAKAPDPAVAAPAGGTGETAGRGRATGEQAAFDFTAAVVGNLDGVKLSDVSIAFEQDGHPQLMTGEAIANWHGPLRLEARLASHWLDLDQISASGPTSPLEATRDLIERIGGLLPDAGTTFASLDVEQVNLGGDVLSGLRLALVRVAGRTSIGELKAALPGNARADIHGILGADGDPKAFEGEVVLRGASFQRFSAWAGNPRQAAETPAVRGKGDGAFSLASRLKMVPGRIELSDASIEFAGAQLHGNLDWSFAGDKQLGLVLDGTTIDVSGLAPGLLDLDSWRGKPAAAGRDATAAVPPGAGNDRAGDRASDRASDRSETPAALPLAALGAKARQVNAAIGKLRVKVRAQALTDGINQLRDVDADLSFENDALHIPGLKFVSPDGVLVDVQGDLESLETIPTGRIKGWLSARSAASVQALRKVFASDIDAHADWPLRVSNIDLGFTAVLGAGAAQRPGQQAGQQPGQRDARQAGTRSDRLALHVDGAVDDGRVDLALTLAGGLANWRQAPIDLVLNIDSPDMPSLMRRLVSGREPTATAGSESAQGSLVVKAAGTSAADLMSYAQLDLSGVGLTYTGRASVAQNNAIGLAGDLAVIAADAGDLLMLAGASRKPMLGGIGVEGAVAVSRDASGAVLQTRGLAVGSSQVSGRIALSRPRSAATGRDELGDHLAIDGRLSASRVSIPGLLGLVVDGRDDQSGEAAASPVKSRIWPDGPFALGLIDNVSGRIAITSPSLQVADRLEVADAAMTLAIGPGGVEIADLTGTTLGGRVRAAARIEKAPAGATLSVDGRVDGAKLVALAGNGGDASAAAQDLGQASIALKVSGRALGPAAALTTLAGTGEIELDKARVRGIAPTAIDRSAQLLIEGQDDIGHERLEQVVRGALAGSRLELSHRRLPVTVADGIVKVGALQLETPDATIRNLTTVDLAALKFDSEWQIAPRKPQPVRPGAVAKAPLPPITLVWSGPLSGIAGVEPRLSVDALEREITVRKAERDLERLEELRRQDEERARQEAERLKQLDEAAQGPGAGSTAPPVIQAPFLIQAPRPAVAPAIVPPTAPPR